MIASRAGSALRRAWCPGASTGPSWRRHAGTSTDGLAALEYASTCVIPTTPHGFPLVAKEEINHDSTLYEFGLPASTTTSPSASGATPRTLGLPTCACILAVAPGIGAGGEDGVRPYTPVSSESMEGKFQLLVKR